MDGNNYEVIYENNFVNNKEFELGVYCLDEGLMQESDEYKQVFKSAETYLKKQHETGRDERDTNYHALTNFRNYVDRNHTENITNTWGGLASVFLLLTWYSLRILRAPWRKSYFKIKTYTGHFQHAMYSNFSPSTVEELMEKMGYIFHRQQQTFLFHQQSLASSQGWRNTLMLAGMDFFLVHVHCSLACTKTGRSLPVQSMASVNSSYSFDNSQTMKFSTEVSSYQNEQNKISKPFVASTVENLSLNKIKHRMSNPHLQKTLPKSNSETSRALGNVQEGIATTYPRKSKKSNRPIYDDEARVEVVPNTYTRSPRMIKQSNRIESNQASVPWKHRIAYHTKHQPFLPSSQRIANVHQYSDDSDDMSLYEGRDTVEPSIADGKICYPPREISLKSISIDDAYISGVPHHKSKQSVGARKLDISKSLHNRGTDSFGDFQKNDNYVIARPIQEHGNSHFVKKFNSSNENRDRVESGYYSEWATSSAGSKAAVTSQDSLPITYSDYVTKKPGVMSGYEYVGPAIDRSNYVHRNFSKRSPADGRPEPVSHIYHEITEDRWGETSTNVSSSTRSKWKLNNVAYR